VYSHRLTLSMLWAIAATLVVCNNVMAYVGPGAGMEFIGYAASLAAMVGVAFLSFLLWPFYTLMRWVRGNKKSPRSTEVSTPTPVSISDAAPAQPVTPSNAAPSPPPPSGP
jgi:hypothetical protein